MVMLMHNKQETVHGTNYTGGQVNQSRNMSEGREKLIIPVRGKHKLESCTSTVSAETS